MADHNAANDPSIVGAVSAALGSAVTVIGGKVIARFQKRDEQDSRLATGMVNKLFKQVEGLQDDLKQCQEHHRECEERAGKLEGRVEAQGERLQEAIKRLGYKDLME